MFSSVVGKVSMMVQRVSTGWLVLEGVRALACCPVPIEGEPAVYGSSCRSLSPLYKASGELGETLQL